MDFMRDINIFDIPGNLIKYNLKPIIIYYILNLTKVLEGPWDINCQHLVLAHVVS